MRECCSDLFTGDLNVRVCDVRISGVVCKLAVAGVKERVMNIVKQKLAWLQ